MEGREGRGLRVKSGLGAPELSRGGVGVWWPAFSPDGGSAKIEFDTGIVQLLGRVARSNLLFCLKVFPCCAFVIPIWLRSNVVAPGSGNRFLGQRTHVLSVNATSRDCPKLPQTPTKLRVGLHHPLPGQHPHNFDLRLKPPVADTGVE